MAKMYEDGPLEQSREELWPSNRWRRGGGRPGQEEVERSSRGGSYHGAVGKWV